MTYAILATPATSHKAPYSQGGGEADSPQHCGKCHVFLENPLTDDGRLVVMECANAEWDAFYGIRRDKEL